MNKMKYMYILCAYKYILYVCVYLHTCNLKKTRAQNHEMYPAKAAEFSV